ncbi:carbohydrate ABC transporter permease [Murimonas intestini]|uniref:Carbohydrate ABC transporter membrane protein 2 (CUT1 family) n=2 Tax=Murimonas intestini TaxID=1337051 RepID=A0AB73T2E9_9FIRM|nr:carbohydrate ABC transporter permease [Murimonas intestini]MCR1841855.1 carbohydrate ABC transporter permease [Murimonas intestini]MCR1865670.1 carbohydrate ABC transporter permease [Murimonas intestini]MCR1886309.1 carbohydrate ABC transporter permease [Murimonas intestini]
MENKSVKKKRLRGTGGSDRTFYIISGIGLSLFLLAVLYPIVFVVAASFSSGQAVSAGKVFLWPVDFSLEGYKTVFHNKDILIGFKNSIVYTVVGTLINLVMTMISAYALSRDDVPGTNKIMLIFTFTMFFSGGMIPTYMLIRSLHMLDSIWSMVIPGAVGVYNLIIARTFIKNSIPGELLDAAKIDGCSDIKYFTMIVLPLSKAIIAVLVLFYGVGHWNSYFNPMLYLNSRELFSLPIFLKEILIANQIDPSTVTDPELQMQIAQIADVIKYALIVVSTIPVLVIYPFIQKYFVKGVMIGSVKG